ncbi:MAG: molecular chaperone TorD family protein [Anaerolineae bacterium]|jgi:ferredoxin
MEEAARARAAIYLALAEAMAQPVLGIGDLLQNAAQTGARVLGSSACQRAALALAERPVPGLEVLRQSYTCLLAPPVIASPGRRPVALYESLHRHGRLAGPATWDVEQRYQALGLTSTEGELPDHASLELAFLGHLAAAEAEAQAAGDGRLVARVRAEQRQFLRTHAGAWLPVVGTALAAAADPFYLIVGRLLNEFLSEELLGREQGGQTKASLPTLKNPAACTLCGLCVGSCPLGSLRMLENDTETMLTLNPSQCVGCNRCARICPQQVLSMSLRAQTRHQTRTKNGAGYQILWHSPRAACPNCGEPTVSQAELEAVFARLQPDRAMQRRLSLCVACKSWSR